MPDWHKGVKGFSLLHCSILKTIIQTIRLLGTEGAPIVIETLEELVNFAPILSVGHDFCYDSFRGQLWKGMAQSPGFFYRDNDIVHCVFR